MIQTRNIRDTIVQPISIQLDKELTDYEPAELLRQLGNNYQADEGDLSNPTYALAKHLVYIADRVEAGMKVNQDYQDFIVAVAVKNATITKDDDVVSVDDLNGAQETLVNNDVKGLIKAREDIIAKFNELVLSAARNSSPPVVDGDQDAQTNLIVGEKEFEAAHESLQTIDAIQRQLEAYLTRQQESQVIDKARTQKYDDADSGVEQHNPKSNEQKSPYELIPSRVFGRFDDETLKNLQYLFSKESNVANEERQSPQDAPNKYKQLEARLRITTIDRILDKFNAFFRFISGDAIGFSFSTQEAKEHMSIFIQDITTDCAAFEKQNNRVLELINAEHERNAGQPIMYQGFDGDLTNENRDSIGAGATYGKMYSADVTSAPLQAFQLTKGQQRRGSVGDTHTQPLLEAPQPNSSHSPSHVAYQTRQQDANSQGSGDLDRSGGIFNPYAGGMYSADVTFAPLQGFQIHSTERRGSVGDTHTQPLIEALQPQPPRSPSFVLQQEDQQRKGSVEGRVSPNMIGGGD